MHYYHYYDYYYYVAMNITNPEPEMGLLRGSYGLRVAGQNYLLLDEGYFGV